MTIQHPEILLLLGMVGLYLYDSTILLDCCEGILSLAGGSRWSVFFGSDHFQIRGKEPFLPNPLFPHRPLFRLSWQVEGMVGPIQPWVPPGNIYSPLGPFIWGMAFGLFCLIPTGLFSRLGNTAIATGIVLFYVNAILALVWVWWKRSEYRCSTRQFVALAAESLTCPPFALNMVRHLSMQISIREDLLSAGRRWLSQDEWAKALEQVAIRVDNEIEWETEGTERALALNTHRYQLQEESKSCQAPNL